MSRLVIFDIDGTLVPGASSEVRFARYLWHKRQLGLPQILSFIWFSLRYLRRYPRNVLQKNKAYLAGLKCSSVESLAEHFVHEDLWPILYRPALLRLRAHQAAGEMVVLLSGTPSFIAQALADALGVADSEGAECASRDGQFTAHPPVHHPHGQTKLAAAEKLAARAGLPLENAVAYGDSGHDIWLFNVVAEGVAVRPKTHLRSAAASKGWEIID